MDSYQVTEEYFRRLKNLAAVACLEDLGISYPVDLLVNYNLYSATSHCSIILFISVTRS